MKFIRLAEGNDWGFRFIQRKESISASGTHDRKHALIIPEGTTLRVMWENQVVVCETFNMHSPGGEVPDHGHSSSYAGSDLPYVFVGKRARPLWEVDIAEEDLAFLNVAKGDESEILLRLKDLPDDRRLNKFEFAALLAHLTNGKPKV